MNSRTWAIGASAALLVVCSVWAYTAWAGGWVVCSVYDGRYTFKVREIPKEPPGLNDGYAYRCEVWDRHMLLQASTYTQDSWTARDISITPAGDEVVFHVGGYDIACKSVGISADGVWSGGEHE